MSSLADPAPVSDMRTAVDGNVDISVIQEWMAKGRELMQKSMEAQDAPTTTSSRSRRSAEPKTLNSKVNGVILHWTFAFSLVRLSIFLLASFIGRHVLGGLITKILPPTLCTVIGAAMVPLVTGYYYENPSFGGDFFVIWFESCIAHGLFVGAGLSHLSLPSEPFLIFTNFACMMMFTNSPSPTRLTCLLTIIITSLLVHLPIGYLFGWLNLPYLALTAAYTLAALIPIEFQLENGIWTMIAFPSLAIFAKCLIYGMYGVSNDFVDEETL